MDEPSVLDYVKSKLAPRKYPLKAPGSGMGVPPGPPELAQVLTPYAADTAQTNAWPWRSFLGLLIALLAQRSLEPQPNRSMNGAVWIGLLLFACAGILIAWAAWRDEWQAAALPETQFERIGSKTAVSQAILYNRQDPLTVRGWALIAGVAFALLAFLNFSNNLFTPLNLGLLILAVFLLVVAFWRSEEAWPVKAARLRNNLSNRQFRLFSTATVRNSAWVLSFLTLLALSAYFRFADLAQTPGEMNSDHAEKIYDVMRVLAGQTNIFFPNNGGREALQMYLVAGLYKFFGAGLNFMTLKIVSTLVGFLALPFYYLLGREVGNRRVGLLAMAFAGVAYWPNVVSRLGLRLPFYFLFTAVVTYFLLRALRVGRRNDFIFLGLALGLSFFGYSADRALPLLVLLGMGVYMLHPRPIAQRKQAFWLTLMALVIAGVVFLPMLRYLLDQPESFLYRTLTRISSVEQPLPSPALLIFLRNTGRALTMFSWSDGEVWTTSIPFRPALDTASGALFWAGVTLVFVTYLRKRQWQHLFLLLSIPVLMLPSIMSLAFPSENPNLYRTGGAAIPVFLLVGLALDGLMTAIETRRTQSPSQTRLAPILAWGLAIILFFISAYQSYNLTFNQYRQQYELAAWNTSEMGQVVKDFAATFGKVDNVWVMGYPYWVDTRLIGIISGYPLRNFAMFVEDLGKIPVNSASKLFLINPQDQNAISALQQRYSQGVLSVYPTKNPDKKFLIFFVPPEKG
jgi:hypothetical protein